MLAATTSRSREEEIKCIYAKEMLENSEERHFQAEFLFKCSNQWPVLKDIHGSCFLKVLREKREGKDGTAGMRQCVTQEKENLPFLSVFY